MSLSYCCPSLATDPDDAGIVSAVINMGNSLHMLVVAEGIETAEQVVMLCEQRCPEGQGYRTLPALAR